MSLEAIKNYCRVCFVQEKNAVNIFSSCSFNSTMTIADVLMECAPVKVISSDEYSSSICCECIKTLEIVYSFRKKCLETDYKLKEISSINAIEYPDLFNTPIGSVSTDCDSDTKEPQNKIEKCDICDKILSTKKSLKRHKLIHTSPTLFKCDLCDQTYSQKHNLKIHTNKYHSNEPFKTKKTRKTEKKFKCDCGKSFRANCELLSHLRVHRGEKKYMCDTCGKTFVLLNNLTQHLPVHGERKHACEICGKKFHSQKDLRKHSECVHEGKRPHKCNVCGKMFASRNYVEIHIKSVHIGELPFGCDLCSRKFARKFTLTEHRRVHTGEKPHKCRYCEKSFTQHTSLIRHTKTHTVS